MQSDEITKNSCIYPLDNVIIGRSPKDFTGAGIPIGHETAAELHETGVINPGMTIKQLKAAIAKATKEDEPETTEDESETEETEEPEVAGEIIRVTDENSNAYDIPVSVLAAYRVTE